MDLSKIKLIASEVDGVVTEHLSTINEMGYVLFKQYYMKDFEAINEMKKLYTFAFVSGDNAVNYNFCRDKNIPFFWDPRGKKEAFVKMMRKYNVTPEEILYVGCSYSDLDLMSMSEVSVCPADAVHNAKNIADVVFEYSGGCGVLCELLTLLVKNFK